MCVACTATLLTLPWTKKDLWWVSTTSHITDNTIQHCLQSYVLVFVLRFSMHLNTNTTFHDKITDRYMFLDWDTYIKYAETVSLMLHTYGRVWVWQFFRWTIISFQSKGFLSVKCKDFGERCSMILWEYFTITIKRIHPCSLK